jgi:hypothetical protein
LSTVDDLASQLGEQWHNMRTARENSAATLEKLTKAVSHLTASDTSIVVSGSLARFELTSGSDIDWTMLLDGSSDPRHYRIFQEVAAVVGTFSMKDVGREGTFGSLVSSHDLINYIGGEGDTNSNTTRRNLLLLESRSVGSDEAYNRVKKNLLQRYLAEDSGLWRKQVTNKLPHFLLNDLARYWRTMTVDYAYKERTRGGKGIPLRNLKLGMSRKLIYVAGLLACYECHLGFDDESRDAFYAERNVPALVARMHHTLRQTPLEITASLLMRFPVHQSTSLALFQAYDRFLGLLLDADTREHLENLHSDQAETDSLYQDAKATRRQFQEALTEIFLTDQSELGRFTIRYGVF